VLPKGPAANEERGRTPDLVSDKSAPNRSARTHGYSKHPLISLKIKIKQIKTFTKLDQLFLTQLDIFLIMKLQRYKAW